MKGGRHDGCIGLIFFFSFFSRKLDTPVLQSHFGKGRKWFCYSRSILAATVMQKHSMLSSRSLLDWVI